jgi:hypothetical protein
MFQTQNLYQNDPQWKSSPLGFASETIGGWGCFLTSVTMMVNGLGYNETPLTANEKMKAKGGFQEAMLIPAVVPYAFPNVIYKGITLCTATPANTVLIDAALSAGKPVIVQVDWNPDVGIQTHFVLLKDKKGDDYVLYDPYKYSGDGPDKDVLLTQRYHYQGTTAASAISAILWFDAVGIPPKPPQKTNLPLPAEKFVIYAAEDDLALRADPNVAGYLWKRMVAGTELICLEDKATAQAKIGQQGKWIQIQDPAGDQGYVAAWYVALQKGAPPPAQPAAAPATTVTITAGTSKPATPTAPAAPIPPLPVGSLALMPTEELAFRTQPVISSDTLIRRVPPTEQLASAETANQILNKVGVQGQWIKVRDGSGKEGYVAGWYVKYASGSAAATAAAAAPAPPAAGTQLTVKTTVEGVALRKQTVVSDATLIKRMPMGTVLTVTETGAEGKIGVNNQWLKVKDPTGTDGYVAAWFVGR